MKKTFSSPVTCRKNDLIEVEICDLNNDGEGIGRADAFIWFIKDTVPGDIVRASVMKVKKSYGYARLVEIISPGPDRVVPPCPVARPCGGCTLQAMSYKAQLAWKRSKVLGNLRRIGGFDDTELALAEDIIGMAEPWRYRGKAIYPIGRDKKGHVVTGFYAGHTHDIIPVEDCIIAPAEYAGILRTVRRYYDDSMRHILIRKGYATGQIMVCIVSRTGRLRYERELAARLHADTVLVNINPDDTNVILGSKERVIKGAGYIEDCIGDLRFRISARSFFQVNPIQVSRLYDTAVEYAALTGDETVWDLYCGIGTITLSMARRARHVYGVEIVEQAIIDARANAVLNGIDNVTFFTGKAEEVLPTEQARLAQEGSAGAHPDVIVVDPPRKGCDSACLDTILSMAPSRVVYVSCDSATLARDLRILCDGGYRLTRLRPVDMFPQTGHVETCVLLTRSSNA